MRYIHFCLLIGGIIVVYWTNVFDFVAEARSCRDCGESFVTRARNRGINSPSPKLQASQVQASYKHTLLVSSVCSLLVTLSSERAKRRSTLVLVDDDNALEAIRNHPKPARRITTFPPSDISCLASQLVATLPQQ